MAPTVGIVFAAALLVAMAGAAKLLRPDPTRVALRTAGLPSAPWTARVLGVGELALAVVALVVAGRLGAGLVGVAYLGFAGFAALLLHRSRGRASCGCFGGDDAPVTRLHVGLNLLLAAAVVPALIDPTGPIWEVADDTPWAGVPFLALVVVLTWLLLVALTVLPAVLASARPAPSATGHSTTAAAAAAAAGLPITPKPGAAR